MRMHFEGGGKKRAETFLFLLAVAPVLTARHGESKVAPVGLCSRAAEKELDNIACTHRSKYKCDAPSNDLSVPKLGRLWKK